jgi:uncharacterized damage-inducible protein DinB
MTVKTKIIKDFAQIGFDRLGSATKNLKPEQLDWKSCTQANTIRWILTHLSQILNVGMAKFLSEAPPKAWPKDYVGNEKYKMEKIMADIEKGHRKLNAGLNKLTNEKLAEPVEGWEGKKSREYYLMLEVSEIIHHEGQVAAILGVEKRMKGAK